MFDDAATSICVCDVDLILVSSSLENRISGELSAILLPAMLILLMNTWPCVIYSGLTKGIRFSPETTPRVSVKVLGVKTPLSAFRLFTLEPICDRLPTVPCINSGFG